MSGGGGFVGPGGDANGGPQGTEYTLQGVMRFLQTEWHRHERDRNAWEIERAEMKSRIGKLEGDVRTSKRLHESLGKHVRLLEAALKKEREKVRKLTNNEPVEDLRDPKEIARESINALKSQRPKPDALGDLDPSAEAQLDHRQEAERDKSRLYLSKCSQEIAYHVIPSAHPPPDLGDLELSNHVYGNQQLSQQSLEEAYIQQQRQKHQASNMMAREVPMQNHQPIVRHYPDNMGLSRAPSQYNLPATSRDAVDRRGIEHQQTPITSNEDSKQSLEVSLRERGGLERQVYDAYGSQAPVEETSRPQQTEENPSDADGWNFDDPPEQAAPPESIPQRPDVDAFPNANFSRQKSPARSGSLSHRRKSSGARRKSDGAVDLGTTASLRQDSTFKVRFALRGHLDVVRAVIFTGGGSPSEPEICTCSDDGTIKRWFIPASFGASGHTSSSGSDLDITSYFTHRGHVGAVTALAACSPSQNFSNGGRTVGDGWVFSGGQDASVRVWERGRVDPKATLDGHSDAVWGLCVLPGTAGSIFGDQSSHYGGPDRVILASGAADGKIIIWAIVRTESPSPTCISPLSLAGINFVVSYTDASILVYDTRTGEEIVGMASLETYDGTRSTGVNSVVATTVGFDGSAGLDPSRTLADEEVVHGATGSSGVEGVVISGYEDRYIRFFDANSGQCTYTMLAHPSAIASLSLSPDGRELVSAGHDASLRFWNLEKRSCTQEITSHRLMRGEGVCSVVWSRDGRWVVGGGGDGVVKVFSR
ncbi:hypothetical protein AN8071.2 [Aspergillus nidulans FGSC A4]|uniref:Striatin N-terminal domain-containing protein n=1 Tax=Emericella nidulans (strain FGSC A4 / ATCC 38163 / CBS 112.46 / NRRL 194 / M139) TaxID=227321 RepID=Q5AUF9_EMENI|nr:protein strA [Aspergillus nidulans FGSC A4]EAA59693.1 hypothetical protein AN8071.2 [Aspergillus nidulans FGSC A4]CBF73824.1 TPA: conserved hypothetical protein similar to striatin (Eurofung) [Aspergillus nidulans FGSC A4]|eukprot:XP_681340.1 hypothetical protein AN8071.2 [Aspergillus nidulans FGSC A4]